jgi:hypothetical protein
MSDIKQRVSPPPMAIRDIMVEDDNSIVRVWLDRINWKPFADEYRQAFCAWVDNFNERQSNRREFRLRVVTTQLRGGDDMLPFVARAENYGRMGIGEVMEATFQILRDELDPPDIKELRIRIDDATFNLGAAKLMGAGEDSTP